MNNIYRKCKLCEGSITEVNTQHNLVKCNDCKLVFCIKKFTDEEFVEVYDKLYNKTSQYSTHINEYNDLQRLQKAKIGYTKQRVLNFLLKRNVKNVCEIGAGVGSVASYFKDKNIKYLGIELDEKTSKRAQYLGLNVLNGSFKELDNIDEKFDAIIAFEVIEHIQELDLFLNLSLKKIKKGKYLGFTVPNYNKRLNYKKNNDNIYQSGPPIHLNFFTLNNIENIARKYNFEIEFLEQKRFPYMNFKKIDTYKFIVKSLFGSYHGSTLKCVLKKK